VATIRHRAWQPSASALRTCELNNIFSKAEGRKKLAITGVALYVGPNGNAWNKHGNRNLWDEVLMGCHLLVDVDEAAPEAVPGSRTSLAAIVGVAAAIIGLETYGRLGVG
jgi:hypothetical protein